MIFQSYVQIKNGPVFLLRVYNVEIWLKITDLGNIKNPSTTQNFSESQKGLHGLPVVVLHCLLGDAYWFLVIITAWRVCIARTLPWQDVCPSVRLSVTRRYCVYMVTHILKVFSPSGSPTILVFFPNQMGCQYTDGDNHNGGVECKRVWKNHDFQPISRFISQNDARESHSYYGRRIGNRTQAFEWYRFGWSWVTCNPDFKVMISFIVK